MSFFSDFNKVKKQHDILELRDLNPNDGEGQIMKLTQIAQSRINNFDRVYNYLNEEFIQSRNYKEMDEIPKIVKEAMTDLDEIVVVIKAMQNMQLVKKTEHQLRSQKVQKLQLVLQDMKSKLQSIIDQLQSKQKQSINVAQKQAETVQDDKEFQLLQEDLHFDEQFVERRQKQIVEMGQVVYSLNQMMNDAALMIEQQGVKVDEIVGNIKSSKGKVQDAGKEVAKAQSVQKGSGNRVVMFCVVLTLIVIVVVLLLRAGAKEQQ